MHFILLAFLHIFLLILAPNNLGYSQKVNLQEEIAAGGNLKSSSSIEMPSPVSISANASAALDPTGSLSKVADIAANATSNSSSALVSNALGSQGEIEEMVGEDDNGQWYYIILGLGLLFAICFLPAVCFGLYAVISTAVANYKKKKCDSKRDSSNKTLLATVGEKVPPTSAHSRYTPISLSSFKTSGFRTPDLILPPKPRKSPASLSSPSKSGSEKSKSETSSNKSESSGGDGEKSATIEKSNSSSSGSSA